ELRARERAAVVGVRGLEPLASPLSGERSDRAELHAQEWTWNEGHGAGDRGAEVLFETPDRSAAGPHGWEGQWRGDHPASCAVGPLDRLPHPPSGGGGCGDPPAPAAGASVLAPVTGTATTGFRCRRP